MSEVRVIPRKEEIPGTPLAGAAIAIIDVLRATSTITTALAHGARAVIPCAGPEEARRTATAGGTGYAAASGRLLAGEEGALKIPGFDLGNSPREYLPEVVSGREIALVTTNGTRAIRLVQEGLAAGAAGSQPAPLLFLASLLNAGAAADALAGVAARGMDVLIVCSGTAGHFSLDDFLCAGALVSALDQRGAGVPDDLARAARDVFRHHRHRLAEALGECRHARLLEDVGLGEDIAYCAELDRFSLVPAVCLPVEAGQQPVVTLGG